MSTENIAFENFYETTLSSDISDTATDIFLDTVPTGDEGYLVIEPDVPANREVIYYTSKTASKVTVPSGSGNGRGYDQSTAVSHLTGAKVIMAPVAAMFEDLKTLFTTTPQGWTGIGTTPTIGTGDTLGNRSFNLTFPSVDLTSTLSPGMRIKLDRGTTPSTQCADFEESSSQYASLAHASVSGISFTSTFTCEAWIKLESFTGSNQAIVSKYTPTTGFILFLKSSGQIQIGGYSGAAANQNKITLSYQSIPLNKWVHVSASMDMAGSGGLIYIDGVLVPSSTTNSGTSLSQAGGNLEIGSYDGANFFDGKISDVRLWSDIRSQTEIQDNMYQALVGNETGLVGYWKLNGDFTDETSNSNDLTASGGVVATTADNPFNATEYGVITSVSYSTNTTVSVFCPEGYGIPNETLSNPFYSTQSTPFGFPGDSPLYLTPPALLCSTITGITAVEDTGIEVTFTIPSGFTKHIQATAYFRSTVSTVTDDMGAITIKEGSTVIGQVISSPARPTSGTMSGLICKTAPFVPTAGTHTYKLTVERALGGGTLQFLASTTYPAFLMVEVL